jgi:hypothetical protein
VGIAEQVNPTPVSKPIPVRADASVDYRQFDPPTCMRNAGDDDYLSIPAFLRRKDE